MAKYYDPADSARANPLEPLSDETKGQIERIRTSGQSFYDLCAELPQSADMTLAKRKVEEAIMWAVKAVTA